jgi:hypothetical protein
MVSRFVRRARTDSGAAAVEVVTKQGQQVTEIDHVGSAHTDAEPALLLEAVARRLHPGAANPGSGWGAVAAGADAGHG